MDVQSYLVIDLEATCDDRGAIQRQHTEIIEIGAVLVDAQTLSPIDEFQRFIRPVRHPRLTPFCIGLTSIQQADVDAGVGFRQAIKELEAFMGNHNPLFCSWGAYDNNQFKQDARYHKLHLPFKGQHLNLKQAFSDALGTTKRFGMAGALRRVGLPLTGTHHRGIDDARNIARLLPYCLGRASAPVERAGYA
ncbi:exonuclease domain-containing protein [Myxococcota bacterium]|nr:exonuclease domain-containing protein [Myxococcota bacterium]